MSKRQLVGLSLAVVLVAGVGAAVTMPVEKIGFGFALGIPDQVLVDRSEVESMISQLQAWLAEATTTTTEAPTTTAEPTTTEAPTTTAEPTTTAAPTTTTRVRPTTTVPGTTSTTAPPIPPPVRGVGARFTIMLGDATRGIMESWWNAEYYRDLQNGYGWTDGDRAGYKCAHMFLLDMATGDVLGRVTFTRVVGASYAGVNDQSMIEGSRHFDGTPNVPISNSIQAECPSPTADYEPNSDPDQRPTITFEKVAGVLEIRDYKLTDASPIVKFRQVEILTGEMTVVDGLGNESQIFGRVTVIADVLQGGIWNPALVIYYDSLVPEVSVESDLP